MCTLSHTHTQTANNYFIIRRPPAIMTAVSAKQLLSWVFQWNDPIKGCWLIFFSSLFFGHIFWLLIIRGPIRCVRDAQTQTSPKSWADVRNICQTNSSTFCREKKTLRANWDAKSAAGQRQIMLSKMQPSWCLLCDFLLWNTWGAGRACLTF